MDRLIEEWCSYNFVAGSFHIKKLCSRCFRQKLIFTVKTSKIAFCATCGGLRSNVHGSSMDRWKARDQLPISGNWTFFSPAHTVEMLWAHVCRNCDFRGGGWVTLSANFSRNGWPYTNDCWRQKTRVCVIRVWTLWDINSIQMALCKYVSFPFLSFSLIRR